MLFDRDEPDMTLEEISELMRNKKKKLKKQQPKIDEEYMTLEEISELMRKKKLKQQKNKIDKDTFEPSQQLILDDCIFLGIPNENCLKYVKPTEQELEEIIKNEFS